MTVAVRVAVGEVSNNREISVVSRLTPVTCTTPSVPGIPILPSELPPLYGGVGIITLPQPAKTRLRVKIPKKRLPMICLIYPKIEEIARTYCFFSPK
jgi:hypothetical protein